MKPQIITIVNFVRGAEPRNPALDLVKPVREQIKIMKQYNLTGTFLLQYDAMIRDDIAGLLKDNPDERLEIGAWFEIVQPLVEKAGIKWKGRPGFSWDWHTNAGFTIAYTPKEREKIIDTYMEDFRELFGAYPKSAGCWVIDAHSLAYLSDKYGIDAFCNCRDQWGTDGYTLWGGYYGQAYYPSRMNSFAPASNEKNQINVPVFRMLGSDPIYQYDSGMDEKFNSCEWQDVNTLETICPHGGGSPDWVKWYFKENFNGLCLSFGYAQAGQENSFGWEAMKDGFENQMKFIAGESGEGKISVKTLAEAGRFYKSEYESTPASAITVLSDWKNEGHKSVWYCSRSYRANLFWENSSFYVRDLHLFDEAYRERYLSEICTTEGCVYDNLPLIDGSRWSGDGTRAGIYPVEESPDGYIQMAGADPSVEQENGETLKIRWPLISGGAMQMLLGAQKLEISREGGTQDGAWAMKFKINRSAELEGAEIKNKTIRMIHNGFQYEVRAESGFWKCDGLGLRLEPENGKISLLFGC